MPDWKEEPLGGSEAAEQEMFARFADDILVHQKRLQKQSRFQHPKRTQHAKIQCGVLNAVLKINQDLPKEYQAPGIEPGGSFEECIVRISNASGKIQPDAAPDLRGLAIRIPAGENKKFDLLMTNAQVSHAETARHFMAFVKAGARGGKLRMFLSLIFSLGPVTAAGMIGQLVRQTSRGVSSLAAEIYWSRAPFAIGDKAFQFFAKGNVEPVPVSKDELKAKSPNYLGEDLAERLKNGPVEFEIYLRPFRNESTTPIEIGNKGWGDERVESSDVLFGTLTLPKQEIGSTEAVGTAATVNQVEFNPWNGADIFKPIGNLNRARSPVYRASANGRTLRKRPGEREGILLGIASFLGKTLNRIRRWDKWGPWFGSLALKNLRDNLRQENLYDTRTVDPADTAVPEAPVGGLSTRAADGSHDDLTDPQMGKAGTSFGRNTPLEKVTPVADRDIGKPNPRLISRELMTRDAFKPASTLNVLAAGWIQFMNHDWFAHTTQKESKKEAEEKRIRIPIDDDDPWKKNATTHEGKPVMELLETTVHKNIKVGTDGREIPVYANRQTQWWDASQLYGASRAIQHEVRTFENGKLKFDDEAGLLPWSEEKKSWVTGVADNMWVGLSVMHLLFVREHNAICDALKSDYPDWDDQRLFDVARIINAALLAKIHTVDWTPMILGHPTLRVAMEANWWGLLGRELKSVYGRISDSETISGIVGSPVDHHTAPMSFTEEFVTVYRMHPLLPDSVTIYDAQTHKVRNVYPVQDTALEKSRSFFDQEDTVENVLFSLGVASPGAITLNNYPKFLQELPTRSGSRTVDLAAVDIIRDRERGIPRFNDFRENLRLPRLRTFDQLTANSDVAAKIAEIYNHDIDRVDTMVGLFAETPPKGFGFSDTAFRIFILMASRRLKSDRFFCEDYNDIVYTPLGLEWIEKTDMRTVIRRHYPSLADSMSRAGSAFEPWVKLSPSVE